MHQYTDLTEEKIIKFLSNKTSKYNNQTYATGVVVGLDDHYVKSNFITLKTFYMHHSYPITVIDCGLSQDNLKKIDCFANKIIKIKDIIPTKVYNLIKNKKIKHLNISTLSSVFAYKSGYENIIFMDLDLIFLDNIFTLINTFTKDNSIDIMATAGNAVQTYKTGKIHSLKNEIPNIKGQSNIKKLFKKDIDFNKRAINTGLLLIRSKTMLNNEHNIISLLDYISYYKYYDQTLINILINVGLLNCKMFDFTYNSVLGGLLLKSPSVHDKFSIENINNKISLKYSYKNNTSLNIKVVHFSGGRKPWNICTKYKKTIGATLWETFKNQ